MKNNLGTRLIAPDSKTTRFAAVALGAAVVVPGMFSPRCLAEDEREFFEKRIRPILVERCESCHSAAKGKTQGGLALDSQVGWQTGGESGSPIVPGEVDKSLLIQAIQYLDGSPQMPPTETGGKLPEAEIALLSEWVRRGAHDPRVATAKRGGLTEQELRDWWSFQPLKAANVPLAGANATLAENEIDRFLRVKLDVAGLASSPSADRRTLIRRATYDLTGLPPTAEAVDAFVTDASPTAYESLVESLLQSPHYGERWGRHWLDVVRYADTAGENTDHPIADAWRYRNWVIDAFNRDLPYDQFVREQLAGDLLHASDEGDKYAEGITSTGFLAIARRFDHDADKFMHLTIEDAIDTMGRTFLGLSIACARCHDHKFDPISASDYYALYGIFSSTRFAFPGCEAKQLPRDLVPLHSETDWTKIYEPYQVQLSAIDNQLKALDTAQAAHTKEFQSSIASTQVELAAGQLSDSAGNTLSERSETRLSDRRLASVDVQIGQIIQLTIDPSGDYGADTTQIDWEIQDLDVPSRKWNLAQDLMADSMAANPHADRFGNARTWLLLDGRHALRLLTVRVLEFAGKPGLIAWQNGDNPCVSINTTGQPIAVWTTLPAQTAFAHPAPDGPVAIAWVSPIKGKVSIQGHIADAHPGGNNGIGWRLDHVVGDNSIALQRMGEAHTTRTRLNAERAEIVVKSPVREYAYATTEGVVTNARLQLRGDPEKLGDEVPRRWLELFGAEVVPPNTGSGRLQLARWMSDASNPLTSRVMINRIWHHHFGKGLVPTPNDFGTRGVPPTHPELLDWLAVQFIESGWSIKAMHRLIMHSSAYRQSTGALTATNHASALTVDPNNNLLWRYDRRRLSAEEIRDSLLYASQQLDSQRGGPYPIPAANAWRFTQHEPFASLYETNQRSVYMITLRNRRHPFIGLFDGADPNASTPQRQVTTVPTQSLYFLNDSFFHSQSDLVAQRLMIHSDERHRLNELFQIAFQRLPRDSEREFAATFVLNYKSSVADLPADERESIAWSALSRVLLSSNEFLYLD